MVTIEIDGKPYQAEAGQMLIEITDANGIDIPRFCFHKKLSVAANCRMCLVDVERAPKPMPACATPVMDGMKVFTRSEKALTAQKSVMAFLLINHPLDCPVCDQGGECELQDIALGYGQDISRYQEGKRVVFSKNLGPLIATDMTRCIHCTRCVRFSQEITGLQEMGMPGRGEHTQIGTYVEKNVASELSGNMIDLCPVGALTSKPFRFSARAWEMQQYDTIAPHDALGSNLSVHIRRNQVMRVAPKENEAINEVWISDRDRFSYEGLTADDRLTTPMIKIEGTWQSADWEKALAFAAEGLKRTLDAHQNTSIGALASPTATVEELYLLQKLMRGIGNQNIDHRLRQVDFSDQDEAPLFPYLGQAIADFEQCDSALVIGSHLRKEQPLLNHRLRKATLRGAKVMLFNPIDYEFNFPIAEKMIVAPMDFVDNLAGIAKALLAEQQSGLVPGNMATLLADVSVNDSQRAMAQSLQTGDKRIVLLGNIATAHPQFSVIRALAATIAKLSNATLGYLGEANNTAGAWLAGVLPHRGPAGMPNKTAGLDAKTMLTEGLKGYILLGLEPELDSCDGAAAIAALNKADFVVSLSAYQTPTMETYADVILPIALFAETSGTYVNGEGLWQSFTGAISPPGEARPAWKILRVLGNLFEFEGFNYMASDQVRDELRQLVGDKTANNRGGWQVPESLTLNEASGLQRITEMPIYAVDPLVRRASALQSTQDAKIAEGVHLNAKAYQNLSEAPEVQVQYNGTQVTLPMVLDDRVPDDCVLIYAGQRANLELGAWHGQMELSSAT
ncbi:MAG: NADH-quinone oxidoreductase subunit G [Candidatus Parabeggiatoa sp. nov. 3]|nr:MAG: NADH-quinone oxidoreductase subunit G [Gammaproteobacteria bacterium]RKZ63446.1 MAG: NADH-quinone oxidoreductase subunit G [Gammaproteobacteria bacterium]HEW97432.1 NADH-quinone oxidoreductase subunit G [Beggiatoa sp.]